MMESLVKKSCEEDGQLNIGYVMLIVHHIPVALINQISFPSHALARAQTFLLTSKSAWESKQF